MTTQDQFLSPINSPSMNPYGGVGTVPYGPDLPTVPELPPKSVPVVSPKSGEKAYDNIQSGYNQIKSGMAQQSAVNSTAAASTLSAQDYAQRAGVDVSRVVSSPDGGYMIGPDQGANKKDVANEILKTLGETPAETTAPVSPEQQAQDQYMTQQQQMMDQQTQAYNDWQTSMQQIQGGAHPLSQAEQAQIDAMKATFEQAKQDQIKANQAFEGGVRATNISRGLSELAQYDAEGRMASAVNTGLAKVREIDANMTSQIAKLTKAFRDDDLKALKESYDSYQNLLDRRSETIDKMHSASIAFQKTLDDKKKEALDAERQQQQDYYNQVQKPIQDILGSLAQNGAPPEIVAAVQSSASVEDALATAGDWLQTGTGDIGMYLQYKRDALSKGLTPSTFQDWYDARTAKEGELDARRAYNNAYASAAGKAAAEKTITTPDEIPALDPTSESIMAQTGLSAGAFAYATIGTTALARMSEKTRTQYMEEWRQYQIAHGINGATFRAQYEALNKTVTANLLRNNQAQVAENELNATVENLRTAATDADMKKLRWENIARLFAGKEVNDPTVIKYAFHLEQLRNEFTMYNAAVAGQIDANGNIREIAKSEMERVADNILKDGISKGGIEGFSNALRASMQKMGVVLKSSIAAQDKQVWDLFGVTSPDTAKNAVDSFISSNPGEAENIAKMYEVPGATDKDIYDYLKAQGKLQ